MNWLISQYDHISTIIILDEWALFFMPSLSTAVSSDNQIEPSGVMMSPIEILQVLNITLNMNLRPV